MTKNHGHDQIFFVWSFFLLTIGCSNTSYKESEILSIPVEFSIDRFDKKFHLSNGDEIPKLKTTYPFLFPDKFSDSIWIKRQKDSLQLLLLESVDEKFNSLTLIEEDLEYLF